jgi:hypothetical protein
MSIPQELQEDVKVYKLHEVDIEDKVLQFTNEFPILMGGEPYIIVISKGTFTPNAKNVTIVSTPKEPMVVKNADASKQMGWWCGTLKRIEQDQMVSEKAYIVQGNGTFECVPKNYKGAYTYPFRAYFSALEPFDFNVFQVKYIHTENGEEDGDITDFPADEFDRDFDFDSETGINAIESSKLKVESSRFYDLQGRPLNGMPTTKGLYIVNGKKVVVK